MYRTNTENVDNELSVFKAQFLGANINGLIIPWTVLDNYFFALQILDEH